MDTNQTTSSSPAQIPVTAAPGIFGTKIPATVAFAIAVLLFFMPFVDIKCNSMSLQTVSGFELATGFTMKNNSTDNSFLNGMKTEKADETNSKSEKKDANFFALIALVLGVLGLGLSLTKSKPAIGSAMVAGIASAGALIGLMIDVKKKVKLDIPDMGGKTGNNDIGDGIDKLGQTMNDKLNISVDFTSWFYIAVVALLVAAFFCYKRMSVTKS
ncbi:MAG: hypothetical protein WBC06_05770 [Chitinophagaceae bacterium]